MLRSLCLAAGALAALSTAAFADFYVVQEKSSRDCKVVETRPTESTWIQVGPMAFKSREEADRQLKVICRDRAGSSDGGGVSIERRRELKD